MKADVNGARPRQASSRARVSAGLDGRVAYVALGPDGLMRVCRVGAQLELLVARGARKWDALELPRGEDAEPDREQPRDETQHDVEQSARNVPVLDELRRLVLEGREGRVRADEADGH